VGKVGYLQRLVFITLYNLQSIPTNTSVVLWYVTENKNPRRRYCSKSEIPNFGIIL